ncbi:MAG: hypothetical protein GY854_18550 [Deltaproteobacteria bacterium]|nr:hypothetical protein [Deltaproteobacteria bacterium]
MRRTLQVVAGGVSSLATGGLLLVGAAICLASYIHKKRCGEYAHIMITDDGLGLSLGYGTRF